MGGQGSDIESLLRVGEVIVLHLNPSKTGGPRHKTFVRGWHKPYHITLDRPEVRDRYVPLRNGQPCLVRFLSYGKACGFESAVFDWDSRRPKAYCRVTWPEDVEMISFRRFQRVDAFVPCTLTLGGEARDAEVRDLSIGGCRVYAPTILSEGSSIKLSFALPDGLPIEGIQATVRNGAALNEGALLGCEFGEAQEHLQSDIAFFVAAALRRTGSDQDEVSRVLVVDENEERITAFRRDFEERGWDVFAASSTIEGLLRLRMLPLNALLVSHDQKALSPIELVQLLKTTRGVEDLPVFVYGGTDAAVSEKARAAGAADCFPSAMETKQVCEAIVSAVGEHDKERAAPKPTG